MHYLPPPTLSKRQCFGIRSVLLLGQWEGVSERPLCRNGFTPVKMAPKSPRKIHWKPEVSRDSLSHHELWSPGGGPATTAKWDALWVRSPRHLCSHWHHQLGRREAGVCPITWNVLHSLLLWLAWGGPGIRQNGEQVWTVLWSAPHPPATTAQLGMREEQLGTYVIHKTYQKKNCHNNFY